MSSASKELFSEGFTCQRKFSVLAQYFQCWLLFRTMRLRDSGYWLFLPKPWRGRKIVKGIDKGTSVSKSKRLENILDLKLRKKNRRNSKIDYTKGQSLFVLPKVLSRGIHLWPEYESRLQRWLKSKKLHDSSTSVIHKHEESRASVGSSRRDSLDQTSFYEEDPIRGFYTIWNFNSVKVPKNKLETTEKVRFVILTLL
ncbi:unnamed protein product [Cylicostephanus goldi]|uniref:Uncharacterized protein n=1 Tax=Cylicostephanus goldi TaxID=71465 RepID=A0A3P6SLS9_CYLGO|nr:unnamed protein product [Cylicostephanus goldi]